MRIIKLNTIVLKISGNAVRFLNGLTSNDLDKPKNAFLNIFGRIIATVDQIKSGEDEFLLVIASQAVEAVLNHIGKFARLSKTSITQGNVNVYFDLDGDAPIQEEDQIIPQKAGRLIVSSRSLQDTISSGVFNCFRLKYQIPLHMVDYTDTMVLNVHPSEFTSFTKGCYLGQEPVSKVHHRSLPSWKLSVCFEDELAQEQKDKMTSKAVDPQSGRIQGFVFVANKN